MSSKVGIGWYRVEQWDLLKSSVADPDVIEDSFLEWFEYASAQKAKMDAAGLEPVKVDIDVDELIAWCQKNNQSLNAEARAEFITRKLREGNID